MKDEKKFDNKFLENEQLNDDELDKVVGGAMTLRGFIKSSEDGNMIIKNLAGKEIISPRN